MSPVPAAPTRRGAAGRGIGAALGAALLLLAGAAAAQRVSPISGAALARLCTNAPTRAECDAYISGVADAIGDSHGRLPACIPPATTGTALRATVLRFLKSHPEALSLPAAHGTIQALAEAFPCPR
jgi:hypothetical protein